MKHNIIKTITWRFKDSTESYPQLKNRKVKITSPNEVYENFSFLFEGEVREKFIVFWLSTSNNVIGFEVISEGLLNSSLVHPREVFRGAIVATCANIILAHNHPSGNNEPSQEDISITKRLIEAGKILDISVLDHLIFCDEGFTSLVERRII
jgi:DNA repair protein RadC